MEMARLMEKGGDAIREMAEAVEDDLILTEEMIKTQEEYRVSVDNLEDALAGLKTQLGLALMPLKTEWNEFLAREVVPILRELIQWFTKLPEPIQLAIVSLVLLAGAGAKAAPSLVGIASIINVLGGGGGIAALGSAITGSLIPALAGIGTTIVGAVLSPVGLLVAAIGLLIFTISTLGPEAWKSLQMLWQIFTAVMKRLSYEISAWARNLSRQVTTWFRDVGRGIVDGIWQGIQEAWESLKANVENALNDLLAWVKDAIEAGSPSGLYKREIGFSMGQGTLQGYVESLQAGMNVLAPELLPGSQAISVGHIEYHGAFSRDELNRLDRRHDKRAEGMLERILK
jgi:hypothetical protein